MNFEPPPIPTNRPLPGWITPDVIARTRATFEPLYGHSLTDDQIIELLINAGNLFRLLRDSHQSNTNNDVASARDEHTPRPPRRQPARKALSGGKPWNTKVKRVCP